MPRLTLFESSQRLLADDERGRIAHTPGFIDADTAVAWFAEARSGAAWRGWRSGERCTIGVSFNSVGLNLYCDGRASVALHDDHLYEIHKASRSRSSRLVRCGA